jgi:L-lactate dehydrogenase complex protein LldF
LCGACGEVCPVRIPIPEMLMRLREEAARDPEEKVPHPLAGQGAAYSPQLARVWSLWRTVYSRPALYRAFSWLATRLRVFTPRRQLGWTVHRTPLTPAKQSLHELVRQRQSSR